MGVTEQLFLLRAWAGARVVMALSAGAVFQALDATMEPSPLSRYPQDGPPCAAGVRATLRSLDGQDGSHLRGGARASQPAGQDGCMVGQPARDDTRAS